MRIVLFCFAGRRQNMELQLPLVRRIIDQNPDVEYHVWNLAHTEDDAAYLQTIEGERITVIKDFHQDKPWRRFNDVYAHYAGPGFRDCTFIKIDDDVVFVQADRFGEFVAAVADNPGRIISAQVVNNGACTPTDPGLWAGFKALDPLRLLDVHKSAAYADAGHSYFHDNWRDMTAQPIEVVPTEDWLSINLIGFDWPTMCAIAERVGRPHGPRFANIAGRRFGAQSPIGDEGMCNTLPRSIVKGFVACHLSFGPQLKDATDDQVSLWRKQYAQIGREYLAH